MNIVCKERICAFYCIRMNPTAPNSNFGSQGIFAQIPTTNEKSVSDILFESNILNSEQFTKLKVDAANKGLSLDRALLEAKFVSPQVFYEARAKLLNTPFMAINSLP